METLCSAAAHPAARLALLLGLLTPLPSSAREASAAPVVSWEEIARLIAASPRTAAATLRSDAARSGTAAARAIPNPSLETRLGIGQSRGEAGEPASSLEWGLTLSIPLGWLAQRGARIEAADAEAQAVMAEGRSLRREVLLQLRTLFWSAVYEQARVATLEALSRQTNALRRAVRLRVQKGEARPVEEVRLDVEAEKLAGELGSARSARSARGRQLGLWLGREEARAEADLSALPPVLPLETLRRRVRSGHPALLAGRARVQALAAELRSERLARVPGVSLTAFAAHTLESRSYGAGLTAELPLWSWGSGRIARARSLLAAGEKQLRAEELELESLLIEVQAACQSGVALGRRYRELVVPRAEAVAATVERTYQLGEGTLLEVIDARRTLIETRRHYLATLVQAQTDCGRLSAVAGEEQP